MYGVDKRFNVFHGGVRCFTFSSYLAPPSEWTFRESSAFLSPRCNEMAANLEQLKVATYVAGYALSSSVLAIVNKVCSFLSEISVQRRASSIDLSFLSISTGSMQSQFFRFQRFSRHCSTSPALS